MASRGASSRPATPGAAASRSDASRPVEDPAASRRAERRLQQQELSRTQLLDAAEEVFGTKGYHEATLKEVAELAEFSVGSVYSFFANKDDLFLSVLLRRGAQFLPGMAEAVASSADPVEQLHALVAFEVGFFRAHPHFARLYLRTSAPAMMPAEVADSAELAANTAEAMAIHAGVFERGQAADVLRDGSPRALARLLSGVVVAFQAADPVVQSATDAADAADATDATEDADALSLEQLHDLVTDAFVVRS